MRTCRTYPKILCGFFAVALGVGDDGIYQLQDVLFAVQVGERVIPHGLGKIDGIQHFYPISAPF